MRPQEKPEGWKGAESEDSLFTGRSRPSGMAQGSETLHTPGWKGGGAQHVDLDPGSEVWV